MLCAVCEEEHRYIVHGSNSMLFDVHLVPHKFGLLIVKEKRSENTHSVLAAWQRVRQNHISNINNNEIEMRMMASFTMRNKIYMKRIMIIIISTILLM